MVRGWLEQGRDGERGGDGGSGGNCGGGMWLMKCGLSLRSRWIK